MKTKNIESLLEFDHHHIWHPYSAVGADLPIYPVASANGCRITLSDGRELVDGMSSWWSAIHGYNHPVINQALTEQLSRMSHVMFGGLTHQPAIELAQKLIEITPPSLQTVFFSDSGSVAVEVAMKMAIQYWQAKQQKNKQRFLTVRYGYHGDTFGAMSVTDPVNGMHQLFAQTIAKQIFINAPRCDFGENCKEEDIVGLEQTLKQNHKQLAAIIIEPIVQGAGGMRFYSADYLRQLRELCNRYDVLLILDEIATGFGRTGKLFACEHAAIEPDILCLGKALTGGYLSLAATLTTNDISNTISNGDPDVFMHGPTFMANPLACTAANASIKLLLDSPWQQRIQKIKKELTEGLENCKKLNSVANVRILGAIGVVEMKQVIDIKTIQPRFIEHGVWVRPFGKLIYLMPPFIIFSEELQKLTSATCSIIQQSTKP